MSERKRVGALVYASSPLTSRTRGGGQQPVAELLHLLPRSLLHRVAYARPREISPVIIEANVPLDRRETGNGVGKAEEIAGRNWFVSATARRAIRRSDGILRRFSRAKIIIADIAWYKVVII